jgi:hypothetical protein
VTYLARITECEHGVVDNRCWAWGCPGGTTTRIEVDYLEGVRALLQAREHVIDPTRRNIQLVRLIVDAALGGSE